MPKKRPQPLAPQGAKTISLVKKFHQKHRYIYSFPALVTSSATRSLFPPFLQPYPPPPGHNRRRRAASPPMSCVLTDINRRIPLSLIAPCTYLAPSTSFSPQPNPNHRRIVGRRRTGSASPSTGFTAPGLLPFDDHRRRAPGLHPQPSHNRNGGNKGAR